MSELPQQVGIDTITKNAFAKTEFTDAQSRKMKILNHLTSTGQAASTSELWCIAGTDKVTQRQLQRDLNEMAQRYDLACETCGRTKYWSVQRGSRPRYVLPVLNEDAALAFQLAKDLLRYLLPDTIARSLTPWFDESEKLLAKLQANNLWHQRVVTQREGLRLQAPAIDQAVLVVVYQALRQGHQVHITHLNTSDELRNHQLAPAGLVASNQTLYLLAYSEKHQDYTSFAMHRITQASDAYLQARLPDVGHFLSYVNLKFNQFYENDQPIALVVDFDCEVQRKLLEYRLSDDQQTTVLPDGWLRVKTTVHDTGGLRTWLCGYGRHVRVMEPPELVAALKALRRKAPDAPVGASWPESTLE